jgi:hypothetical protein
MPDLQELWDKARRRTEIIRMRLQDLATFDKTVVPYCFLAESSVNRGDTIMRRGSVLIERPGIILPSLSPQFEGFPFDPDLHLGEDALSTFLLIRGIQFPSLKYRHELSALDVLERSLQQALDEQRDRLAAAEDVATGLVVGPEDAWQFSVLLLVGALVVRSAEGDLRRILENWRKRQRDEPPRRSA